MSRAKQKAPLKHTMLKIPLREYRMIKKQAQMFCQGNVSAWLRHAGTRYKPKHGEIVETVTMPGAKKSKSKKI